MKPFRFAPAIAALCALSLIGAAFGQTGGQTDPGKGQGQGQGQTQGGQQTGGQTKTGQGNTNGTQEDPIQKIRESAKGKPNKQGADVMFDPIGAISAKVGDYVTFKVIARNAKNERIDLVYTLKDGPAGSSIDPTTGVFAWTPTLPGTSVFSITGVDSVDPERAATMTITITVSRPLAPFGYEYFVAPRAAILARLYAIQQGLAMGAGNNLSPFRAQGSVPMNNSLLPDSGAVGTVLNGGTNIGFPPGSAGAAGTGTTTPPTTPPATGGTGTTATGTGTELQGTPPDASKQAVTTFGQPQLNPYGIRQPGQQDPGFIQQLDALKHFVGPFDMTGANVFVPSPERYQLGPGDTLELRVWSPTQEVRTFPLKIDSRGTINLPSSGRRLVLRGQTLAQAEKNLTREVRRDVRDADISLSLTELRTMEIKIIGQAFMPGSYQVPAVMTLFNALYIFGGPTDDGSLRRIELRRSDGTRQKFDLYHFLIAGDSSGDVPLQPGDTIFIPPVEARATVQGEVGIPGIYEVLPNEKLKDVLGFAGNVRPTGVSQRVSQATVEPGKGLQLKDVDITGTGPASNPPVYAGDVIEVPSVRPELTNLVTIEGAVDQPGQYAVSEGLTVASLIQRARGLRPEAYGRADLFRQNDDKTIALIPIDLDKAMKGDQANNIAIKPFDKLTVYRTQDVEWMGNRRVQVRGSVRKPGNYDRADHMRVMDLLLQAGGLVGNAFLEQGFLQRFNDDGTTGELIKIDFRKVAVGDLANNVELKDRDVLTVQSTTEAQFVPEQEVKIVGRVQAPGSFPRATNMTLKDLLQLAGGLMPDAGEIIEIAHARVPDGTKAVQFKVSDVVAGTVNPALEAGDLVTIPQRSDFNMDVKTVIVLGSVMRPGVYAINKTTDRISDVIKRAGGPSPTAFLQGAQFVRDPGLLKTLSQTRLMPSIRDVLAIINDAEYRRALARAEVDKLRISKAVQTNPNADVGALASIGLGQVPKTTPDTVKPIQFMNNDLVTPARPLPEVLPGNINVHFDEALRRPGSDNDLVMAEGDIIIVPDTPSTVTVTGAVIQPSAVLFVPGKSVSYYIALSGGFTADVAKDRILVIRANGEIVKANARTRVELGDVVLVPTKVMAERLSDRQAEVDAISKNVTSAGVIFAVLKSLFGF